MNNEEVEITYFVQILSVHGNSFVEAKLGLPYPGWRRNVQISSVNGNIFVEENCDCPIQDVEEMCRYHVLSETVLMRQI